MAGSPPLIEPENRPTDGQKTDLMMVGKPSPNQTTINNLTESQTKGVSGGRPRPMADMEIFFCHRPNTTSCRQSTLTGWNGSSRK